MCVACIHVLGRRPGQFHADFFRHPSFETILRIADGMDVNFEDVLKRGEHPRMISFFSFYSVQNPTRDSDDGFQPVEKCGIQS